MAKANPETGSSFYVAEGDDVPDDLPEGVRPVGPGAAAPELPPASAPKAAWVDHAEAAGLPRDEAEAMTKASLVEAVRAADPAPVPRPVSTPRPSSPASSAPADDAG